MKSLGRIWGWYTRRHYAQCVQKMDTALCPLEDPDIKISILGNLKNMGRSLALQLKQCQDIYELRLYGATDLVCATAMDLAQMDTNVKVRAFKGDAKLMEASITGSHIVVICGGNQKSPSRGQNQLFHDNADTVRYFALNIAEYNPKAIVLIATPPVDCMVPLVSEEFKKAEVYNPRKIIGLSNIQSVRANSVIANYLGENATHVLCPTIGGASEHTTVTVISQATPKTTVSEKQAEDIEKLIKTWEVDTLKVRAEPCDMITAFAATRFITSLIKAMKGDRECFECAFVRQTGHIRKFLPYMSTIVRLGPQGIAKSYMPKLDERERKALKLAHPYIAQDIMLGQSFVTGEIVKKSRMPNKPEDFCEVFTTEVIGDVVVNLEKYKHVQVYK